VVHWSAAGLVEADGLRREPAKVEIGIVSR